MTPCRSIATPRAQAARRGRTRHVPVGERVDAAARRDDPGGEGRRSSAAAGSATTCRARRPAELRAGAGRRGGRHVQCGPDAGRVRRRGRRLAGGGEPARPRPPHPGLRQRSGHRGGGRGRAGAATADRDGVLRGSAFPPWSTRSASPGSRRTARRSTRRRSPGARRSTPISSSGWRPRSAATWPRSASTRACRRCWTWCATTAGAGSRRPSVRTRTWSRCSVRPTSAACRAPACSPP